MPRWPKRSTIDKVFAKVRYDPSEPGACWIFVGARNKGGQGTIWDGERRRSVARVSYEYHFGPIPDGMCVCHRCDVPACVNPNHLWLGTKKDNFDDMVSKKRQNWSGPAKLNWGQVREIKTALKCGAKGAELAAKYGVSKMTISMIKTGRRWKSTNNGVSDSPS
jgi:hypothetical protein